MAEKNNFLGDQAIKQIQRGLRSIQALENRIGRIERGRGGLAPKQVYGLITDSTGALYDCTQAFQSGTEWQVVENGLRWVADGSVGQLREFNDLEDASGVFPLWQTADPSGDDFQWWFAKQAGDDYTLPFARSIDGTDVTIKTGIVFYGSEDDPKGFQINTDGTWQLDTDRKFFVKWVSTPGGVSETVAINPLLQDTTGEWPDEWIDNTGDLTCHWAIGEIFDGDFTSLWENDIHVMYPYQPDVPAEYRPTADDPSTAWVCLVEDATSIEDEIGKDIIFRGKPHHFAARGGGVRRLYDDGEPEIVIGGVSDDVDQNLVNRVDTSTANEITFFRKLRELDTDHGLVQKNEFGSEVEHAQITFDEIWLEAEINARIKHILAGQGNPPTWFSFSGDATSFTVGGVTGTDFSITLDDAGHVIDATADGTAVDPPEDTTNYRYENCLDSAETIVLPDDLGQVVSIGSDCWEILGETSDTTTHDSVAADFTDCSDCLDTTGFLWLDCSTDTSVSVQGAGTGSPEFDYAWLCLSGAWQRSYNSGGSGLTLNEKEYLDQCGDEPLACEDLVGWHASDDWGGTGCDSGSVSDSNWIRRWAFNETDGTWSIVGGSLVSNINHGSSTIGRLSIIQDGYSISGDFLCEIDFANHLGTDGDTWAVLTIANGVIYRNYDSDPNTGRVGAIGTDIDLPSHFSAGSLRVRRVGATVFYDYAIGVGWTNIASEAFGAAITQAVLGMISVNDSVQPTLNFPFFLLESGTGGGTEVYIDPTGEACP